MVVDARQLYQRIADRIKPTLGNTREWTATQHAMTIDLATIEAVDAGLKDDLPYDTSIPFNTIVVTSDDHAAEIVRDTIRRRIGDDIARAVVAKELTSAALQDSYDTGRTIPVLIAGARDEQEANALQRAWPSVSAVVPVSGPMTNDEVVATFRQIKNQK